MMKAWNECFFYFFSKTGKLRIRLYNSATSVSQVESGSASAASATSTPRVHATQKTWAGCARSCCNSNRRRTSASAPRMHRVNLCFVVSTITVINIIITIQCHPVQSGSKFTCLTDWKLTAWVLGGSNIKLLQIDHKHLLNLIFVVTFFKCAEVLDNFFQISVKSGILYVMWFF